VQTLMQVHGGERLRSELDENDPQFIDLDALVADDSESPRADVA
jgi:hypothetical protein